MSDAIQRVGVAPVEWWELQKRAGDVDNAELRLHLARAAQAEAQRKVLQARGLDPHGQYQIVLED